MQTYKYELFTAGIEEQIKEGILESGDRLPSIREIKKRFHLSTSSVQSGYEYLMIRGLAESIPGSGHFVAVIHREDIPDVKTALLPVVKDAAFTNNVMLTSARIKPSESSSFNAAAPGDLLVPQKLILRTLQEVIREKGTSLLRYYPSNGLQTLRMEIAKRIGGNGSYVNPDELIITDGALQSLTIALGTITNPGDIVAVESPCVFSVLEAVVNLGLKVIEVPVHYRNGFDTVYFDTVCKENDIRALVVTPNFHNPTGIVMSDEAKKELLKTALYYQIPIIENDIYGDLYFGEKRPSCMKSFDDTGLVMTFSSFSKTLAPGIRLGWLYAGKFYAQAEKNRFGLGRTVSPIYQELMLKLLQGAAYERHLRSFRKKLSQQAFQVLDVVRKAFPEGSYFHRPEGGYSIWGQLPEETDMKAFYEYCETNRILFTPGNTFSLSDQYGHHFRIVFADRMTSESFVLLENAGKKVKELQLK
ncbi:PLP-dependent aminotransferase family protein [Chryseobacterium sp. SIMBA_029]|uniref:aminotransferase-like domain-containing protein n=1 Tax=Chryseobacterium sp. SIMBA_029 TaxID=3085772 RepID=UPI00397A53FC